MNTVSHAEVDFTTNDEPPCMVPPKSCPGNSKKLPRTKINQMMVTYFESRAPLLSQFLKFWGDLGTLSKPHRRKRGLTTDA